MGGRGRSSAGKRGSNTTTPATPPPVIEAPKVVTVDDVKAKAQEMGIKVGDLFINELGAEWALAELNRISDTMAEFGIDPSKYISSVDLDPSYAGSAMAYTYSGVKPQGIYAKIKYYSDKDFFEQRYKGSVAQGFHPKGTTYEDVLIHETGHRIEAAVAQKALDKGQLPYAPKIAMWDGKWKTDAYFKTQYGDYATNKLVEQATRNVKKTAYGKGKTNDTLYRGISGYAAAKNKRSETFAEAIADWRRNGNNANPLSIEIVRLTKEWLNS